MRILSSVVFFPCGRIDEMAAFYHKTLGLTVANQTANSIIFDTGYGYLGFVQYDDGRQPATGMCISLNCESRQTVDAVYQRLRQEGGAEGLTVPQKHPNFPVYSFFLKDPNGYTVEFQKMEETLR